MKQIYLFIGMAVAVLVMGSCTTNPEINKAFVKYSHRKGVTSISVPGWVIGLASSFADLSEEEKDLLDGIDKVKVLAVENDELNERINLHEEFYKGINRNGDFEELLTVRENNENVTIFGKMDENVIREMVILVGGDDNALVYIKGEIAPEMINNVAGLAKHEELLKY